MSKNRVPAIEGWFTMDEAAPQLLGLHQESGRAGHRQHVARLGVVEPAGMLGVLGADEPDGAGRVGIVGGEGGDDHRVDAGPRDPRTEQGDPAKSWMTTKLSCSNASRTSGWRGEKDVASRRATWSSGTPYCAQGRKRPSSSTNTVARSQPTSTVVSRQSSCSRRGVE